MLDGLGDGEGGSGGEALGLLRGVAPAADLGDGGYAELLDLGFGHEDDGGGAVVQGSRVGGCYGAVLGLEDRAHGLQLVGVQILDLLVSRDLDGRLVTAAAHFDGNDLRGEHAVGGGLLRARVRLDGVGVLLLAGDGVVVRAQLTGQTHVLLLAVSVRQTILQHAVDDGLVAVLGAVTQGWEVVGYVGHGLGAAGDDNRGVARYDGLGAEDDGLETRGAHLVHAGADYGVGDAGADGTLSGGCLAETGGKKWVVSWALLC